MQGVRGAARRQTIAKPLGRQIADASSSRRDSSDADTFGAATTVTTIGGAELDVDSAGASAASGTNDAAAITAAARPVATSIMPPIDGGRQQKFAVRIRDERTVLNVEIDRYDVVAEADAELGHRHVALVLLVGVERRAIRKRDRQPGVVRSRRVDDVPAHLQVGHAVQPCQPTQPVAVLRTRRGVDISLVLEAHQV
jgi:hypothetical protein